MRDHPYKNRDPESERLYAIRDQLLELIEDHEELCVGKDCQFVIGTIAYLAHSVGIKTTDQINTMERELIQYNHECPHCTARN